MDDKRQSLLERLRESDVWRSVVRYPREDTGRGRALAAFSNVFLHLYPVKVPAAILSFRYSFRLGFIATVLFLILLVTGIYLMFFYTPSPAIAYGDLQRLRTTIGYGQLIRNVHRWAGHLMVLVVILHLVRVFWSGRYKSPRQFNWVIGVGLLVVTLAYSFTGYLLPWDQLSYWAVTVGSDLIRYVPYAGGTLRRFLLGGDGIGQATLLRFYVLHVAVLTVAFVLLWAVHIWRVRKDGFAVEAPPESSVDPNADSTPEPEDAPDETEPRIRLLGVVDRSEATPAERAPDGMVFTFPHLFVRHQVVALATCAICLALGVAFEAPLRDYANPMETPEPAKAPWYFVGLQELLAHVDPLVAGILVPVALGATLLVLPYVDTGRSTKPRDRPFAIALFVLILGITLGLTVVGALFRGPGWALVMPWNELYLEM